MLKKSNIIELIRENKTPCWKVESRKYEFAKDKDTKGSYESIKTDTLESQIENSIAKLELLFTFLVHERCFCYTIDMGLTKNSHGAGTFYYEFIINENQQDTKSNGLNGNEPNPPGSLAGYVPV
jgi:hypothetical protein